MPQKKLYQGYSLKELNAQYDCREMVPEHANIYAGFKSDSDAVLSEYKVHLDVPYGPSKEETLDIYLPKTSGQQTMPINIYLHGGYWYSRHKNDFRFLARGIVSSGAILVVVNYALIPNVNLDEIIRQCRAAVSWTHKNSTSFGADRERIHISGPSAGGHLTAMMFATNWADFDHDLPANLIKGGAALSGIYDLTPIAMTFMHKTLNFTSDQISRNSPEFLSPITNAPLIISVGGDESNEFRRQSEALAKAWKNNEIEYLLMELKGINHFTILGEYANPESTLAQAIQKQMGLD